MRTVIRFSLASSLALALLLFWPRSSRRTDVDTASERHASTSSSAQPATGPVATTSTASASSPEQFRNWADCYAAATDHEKAELLGKGIELARDRRTHLEQLIKTDPRAALELAVPDEVRSSLPASIQALLEERVSGRGFFGVMVANYADEGRSEVRREFLLNGRRYDAYVYGRRSSQRTREQETLWGIAIGSALAVHEDPIRALSAKSVGDAKAKCPVSGLSADTHNTSAFAEVAGRRESFCGAGHLMALNQRLAADGGLGTEGEEPPIAKDGWTQGPRKVLFMRVTYPNDPTEAITESGAYSLMDAVSAWFAETSYYSTWLVTDVTPLMVLPQPKEWYCENGDGYILSDAREVARSYGFDTDNYQLDIVRFPSPGSGCNGYGYGGKAYVGGKGCWMLSNATGTMIHELGHNYGVWHANFWTGLGDGIISHGSHVEYGNSFDVMGSSGSQGQFNANFKNILDWMQDSYVQTVSTSGTYRLFTYDINSLTEGQNYALKIRKDYDRNYWVEFRRKYANAWFLNGVILNWDAWNNGVTNSGSGTHLLDTTPGTPAGNSSKDDCAVVIGRSYSDFASGIHITPVARGDGSLSENWIDVVVNLGNFPSNNVPDASIIADRVNASAGSVINFTAIASDADGDALAYAWDFGDQTFGANAASVAKSWNSTGHYVVRCTVSDMKGGASTRTVLVTIGSPSTFRASGRVTSGGIPLEGVRVHNGQTGASYRGAYTDSDGFYTVPGLASGSHNLTAVKYGYTIAASGWANPISVGPDAANLDFNATDLPAIGFTLADTNFGEASLNTATVKLTRGGATNSALQVRLNRTGSASFNTDYSMNPAPTGTPLQVTFPAGSRELSILLTPIADSSSEGPEFVTLTLIENANYVLSSNAEVRLTLSDDDPVTKPTVSIASGSGGGSTLDNVATESGGDAASFQISRTGNVANELLVPFTVSGSATTGVDYQPLSGLISIPAGQNSALIVLNAIDDAEVETNETVTVTLLTSAAYTLSSSSNATISIQDDDPATVTVIATDNIAAEPSSTATFVFNRIGSAAANLVVNYLVSGTASNGADYSALSGTITIPAGRPNATLTLTPLNDSSLEGDETVTVQILSSTAYNVGNPGNATIVLQDNELSTVTLTAPDSTASETNSADVATFRFTRTAPTNTPLTVFYTIAGEATPGADYQQLSDSVVIPANATSIDLVVRGLDDSVPEGNERVLVSLLADSAYVVGTVSPVSVTISDNESSTDLPAIGFSAPTSAGPENDTFVQLSLRLSSSRSVTSSVNYVVTGGSATGGGTDYTLAAGTLLFPPNEVNRTLSFSVANDTLLETNETIVISLESPTNAVLDSITNHTYVIVDDDTSGALTISAVDNAANESGDTATFRITRSIVSTNAQMVYLQVLGTANAPTDYPSIPTTVTIPSGSGSVDIVVTPFDDSTDEVNETVIVNLLPSPGARLGSPDVANVTISDNDDSNLLSIVRVEAIDPTASEPGTDTGTFRISRDRGTNSALSIQFTVTGAATSGTDYTNLGTTVTLPAGVWATNLVVFPRNDSTYETNETVILSLTVLAEYRVEPTFAQATINIVDDEQGVWVTSAGMAAENGSSTGTFLISRTGSTASNLPVTFRWSGTASPNDFTPNGTNAVIPAGTNVLTLNINAVADSMNEGLETLVLTLSTNAAYRVLTQNFATITLADSALSPWEQWRATRFSAAELANPLISGPDSDPDGDSLRNLLEYAFNRNPMVADYVRHLNGRLETLTNSPGELSYVVRFTRRKAPTDVVYQLETADVIPDWSTNVTASEILPAVDDGNGITETAAFVLPTGATHQFVRLRVSLSP